jgi:hypothetical protein
MAVQKTAMMGLVIAPLRVDAQSTISGCGQSLRAARR